MSIVSRLSRIAVSMTLGCSHRSRTSIRRPPHSSTGYTSLPPRSVGVTRALQASPTASTTLWTREFSIADRVALVSGGHGGLGLEAALALIEAGARVVYCADLPREPDARWTKVRDYASRMQGTVGDGRMEYVSADVRDQEIMLKLGDMIGNREGRLDIGVAAAGILPDPANCLDIRGEDLQAVMATNVNGALFTAHAAGRQMRRFGHGGSIIFIASIAGREAFRGHPIAHYHMSKAAVLQMTRSLACELASEAIRVNSISPGFMHTNFIKPYLDLRAQYAEEWGRLNPLGRLGGPHELRGAVVWLASGASRFCTGSDIVVDGGHIAW